ncbi:MAG: PPC domain-containing protein, partial [Planctomycetota bacterium]
DGESDLVRGDWVYFQNWVTANNCPSINPLQGENAICQKSSGTRTYIGLGIPPKGQPAITGQGITDELWSAWRQTGCPQEREGGLALDNVIIPSLRYFQDFSSLLKVLRTSVTSSGISGTAGSLDHFRLRTWGGTGDCDLYVRKSGWASPRSYSHGSSGPGCDESVTVNVRAGERLYIAVHGYSTFSGVSLLARSGSGSGSPAATSLTVNGSTVNGNISSAGDVDRYKFTVASPGTYAIETLALSLTDNYMYLYGPNSQTRLIESDDDGGQDNAARIVRNLSPGTYYVKIRAYSASGRGTYVIAAMGPSVLTVNGSTVEGNISSAGDVDWYQFTVSSLETHTIETWAGSLTDNYMYLYGPNSRTRQIESDDDDGQGNAARIVRSLSAGTYYVKIRAYSSSDTGTYTIKTSGPSLLTVNGPAISGDISSAGDVDWHEFTVSSSGTHTIETWAGSLTDNYMYLYGPNSQTRQIESDDDGGQGNAARIVRNLSRGTYYVKIRAYSSSSEGTYIIRVTR